MNPSEPSLVVSDSPSAIQTEKEVGKANVEGVARRDERETVTPHEEQADKKDDGTEARTDVESLQPVSESAKPSAGERKDPEGEFDSFLT